jgi:hypothetical protein
MTFDCAHRPHGFRAAHACLTASDEQDELGREPEEKPQGVECPRPCFWAGRGTPVTGVNNAANSGFLLWLFVPCLGAVPLLVWAAGRPSREPPPSPCPGTRGDAPRCCLVLHLDLLGWHGHPSVSRRRACVVAWLHPFPGLLRGRRGRPLRSVRARPPDRAISRNWLDAARGGRHRRSLLASGGGKRAWLRSRLACQARRSRRSGWTGGAVPSAHSPPEGDLMRIRRARQTMFLIPVLAACLLSCSTDDGAYEDTGRRTPPRSSSAPAPVDAGSQEDSVVPNLPTSPAPELVRDAFAGLQATLDDRQTPRGRRTSLSPLHGSRTFARPSRGTPPQRTWKPIARS